MLLPRKFSRERSFSIPTAKVFPLKNFAVYGILLSKAVTHVRTYLHVLACSRRLYTNAHTHSYTQSDTPYNTYVHTYMHMRMYACIIKLCVYDYVYVMYCNICMYVRLWSMYVCLYVLYIVQNLCGIKFIQNRIFAFTFSYRHAHNYFHKGKLYMKFMKI